MMNEMPSNLHMVKTILQIGMLGIIIGTVPIGCVSPPPPSYAPQPSGNSVDGGGVSQEDQTRLKEEMEAAQEELRTGKVPVPHRESSPRDSASSGSSPQSGQSESSGACVSSPLPQWVTRTAAMQAVGRSTVSQEDADKSARLETVKGLEVTIEGADRTSLQETTDKGFSYAVSSDVVETVQITISGLDIIERHYDACMAQYLSLARLDRDQAVKAWLVDQQVLNEQREELHRQVQDLQEHGEVFRALGAWHQLLEVDATLEQVERRLRYLSPQSLTGETGSARVEQTRRHFESLLASLRLVKLSGDQQRAVTRPTLEAHLVVQVRAGERPLSNVPIQFTVEQDRAEVVGLVSTKADGKAATNIYGIVPSDQSGTVVVAVALSQILEHLPTEVQEKLRMQRERLTVRFTYLPPVFHHRETLVKLTGEAEHFQTLATTRLEQGQLLPGLTALEERRVRQEQWAVLQQRLKREAPEALAGLAAPGNPQETAQRIDYIASSVQLTKLGGDHQKARYGKPLEESLGLTIRGRLEEKEVPFGDVPIRFVFEEGRGELNEVVQTDDEGHAHGRIRQVEPARTAAIVVARIHVEQLGVDLPNRLQTVLKREWGERKVTFTVTPPPSISVDATPLGKEVHQLLLDLSVGVEQSYGSSAIVGEFLENTTQRKLLLSDKLKHEVSIRLGGLPTFQLLDVSVPGGPTSTTGASQSSEVSGPAPAVEIKGVYYAHPPQGLVLAAKVVRLQSQVVEYSVESRIIPRDFFAEPEWLELEDLVKRSRPAPIVTAPAQTHTTQEWVEQFWDLRNPLGFVTELEPDQAMHNDGEEGNFRFRTSQDCYLTLINIGASGRWNVLLPNGWKLEPKNNLIRASEGWVTIPKSDDQFTFSVSPPFGIERVKAICTKHPIRLFGSTNMGQGFLSIGPNDYQKLRNLNVMQRDVDPGDWSETHAQIITLPRGQTETKGQRGLRLRGLVSK